MSQEVPSGLSAADRMKAAIESKSQSKRIERQSAEEIVRAEIAQREATAEAQRTEVEAQKKASQEAIDTEYGGLRDERGALKSEEAILASELATLKEKKQKVKAAVRSAIAVAQTYAKEKPEEGKELMDEQFGKKNRRDTFAPELAESSAIRKETVPKQERKVSLREQGRGLDAHLQELYPQTTEGKIAQDREILEEAKRNHLPYGRQEPFGFQRMSVLLSTTRDTDRGALFESGLFKTVEFNDKKYGEGASKRAFVAGALNSALPTLRSGGYTSDIKMETFAGFSRESLRPAIEARYDLEQDFFKIKEEFSKFLLLGTVESPERGLDVLKKELDRLRGEVYTFSDERTKQSLDFSRHTRVGIEKIRAGLLPDTSEIYGKIEALKEEISQLQGQIRINEETQRTESRKTPFFGKQKHADYLKGLSEKISGLKSDEREKVREKGQLEEDYKELNKAREKVDKRLGELGLTSYLNGAEEGYASVAEYNADVAQALERKKGEIEAEMTRVQEAMDRINKGLADLGVVQSKVAKSIPAEVARTLGARV